MFPSKPKSDSSHVQDEQSQPITPPTLSSEDDSSTMGSILSNAATALRMMQPEQAQSGFESDHHEPHAEHEPTMMGTAAHLVANGLGGFSKGMHFIGRHVPGPLHAIGEVAEVAGEAVHNNTTGDAVEDAVCGAVAGVAKVGAGIAAGIGLAVIPEIELPAAVGLVEAVIIEGGAGLAFGTVAQNVVNVVTDPAAQAAKKICHAAFNYVRGKEGKIQRDAGCASDKSSSSGTMTSAYGTTLKSAYGVTPIKTRPMPLFTVLGDIELVGNPIHDHSNYRVSQDLDKNLNKNELYIYVITEHGELRVEPRSDYNYHHCCADGAPVRAAGEIKFSSISEKWEVNNRTGHYRVHGEHLASYVSTVLKQHGLKEMEFCYRFDSDILSYDDLPNNLTYSTLRGDFGAHGRWSSKPHLGPSADPDASAIEAPYGFTPISMQSKKSVPDASAPLGAPRPYLGATKPGKSTMTKESKARAKVRARGDAETERLNRESVRLQAEKTTFAQALPSRLTETQRNRILSEVDPRKQAAIYEEIYHEMSPAEQAVVNQEMGNNLRARIDVVNLTASQATTSSIPSLMEDVHGVAFAASAFASLLGSPRVSRGFDKIASGAMAIGSGYTTIMATGASAGPVGLCVGGGLMIMMGVSSMFDSDSDDNALGEALQQIMGGIVAVSRQIQQLGEYVTVRFDRLENIVGDQHRETIGFLDQVLFNQDCALSDLKRELCKNHGAMLLKINALQEAVQQLTETQRIQVESQLYRDYSQRKEFHFLQGMQDDRLVQEVRYALEHDRVLDEQLMPYSDELTKAFLTSGTRSDSFTGKDIPVDFSTLRPHHIETLLNRWITPMEESEEAIPYLTAFNINALLRFAIAQGALPRGIESPNLRVLKEFAITLLALHEKHAQNISSTGAQKPIPEMAYHNVQKVANELGRVAKTITTIDAAQVLQKAVLELSRYHDEVIHHTTEALTAFEQETTARYFKARLEELNRVEELARLPTRVSAITSFPEENRVLKYVADVPAMRSYFIARTGVECYVVVRAMFGRALDVPNKDRFQEVLKPLLFPPLRENEFFGRDDPYWKSLEQSIHYAGSDLNILKALILDGNTSNTQSLTDLDIKLHVGETDESWSEKIEDNRSRQCEAFVLDVKDDKKDLQSALARKRAIHLVSIERYFDDIGLEFSSDLDDLYLEVAAFQKIGNRVIEPAVGQRSSLQLFFPKKTDYIDYPIWVSRDYDDLIPHLAFLAEFLGLGRLKFTYTATLSEKIGQQQVFKFGLMINFVPTDGMLSSIPILAESHAEYVHACYTKADEVLECLWYGLPVITPNQVDLSCSLFRHINPFFQRQVFPTLSTSICAQAHSRQRNSQYYLVNSQMDEIIQAHFVHLRQDFNQIISKRAESLSDPLGQAIVKMKTMAAMLKGFSNLLLPKAQQDLLNAELDGITSLHQQHMIDLLIADPLPNTQHLDEVRKEGIKIKSLSAFVTTMLENVLATGDGELHVLHQKLLDYLKTVRPVHVLTAEEKLIAVLQEKLNQVGYRSPEVLLEDAKRMLFDGQGQLSDTIQALQITLNKSHVLVSSGAIDQKTYEAMSAKMGVSPEADVAMEEVTSAEAFFTESSSFSTEGLFPLLMTWQTEAHEAIYHQIHQLLSSTAGAACSSIVNEQEGHFGKTPLHVAASLGDVSLVKLLLSFDARVDIPDREGSLCWQGASRAIRALIRSRGAWLAEIETLGFSLNRTVHLLEQATDSIDTLEHVRVPGVLVIGETCSGKSTLVNAMLGATYEASEGEYGERVVRLCEDSIPESARTSAGTMSETLFPGVFLTPDKASAIVDMPGFGETRGDAETICGGVMTQLVHQQFEQLKGMLMVCPLEDTKPRFVALRSMLETIGCLFEGVSDEVMKDHVLLVITKIGEDSPTQTAALVLKRLQTWLASKEYAGVTPDSAPKSWAAKRVLSILTKNPGAIQVVDVTHGQEAVNGLREKIASMPSLKSSLLTPSDSHHAVSLFKQLLKNMVESRARVIQAVDVQQTALASALLGSLPIDAHMTLPESLETLAASLDELQSSVSDEMAGRIRLFLDDLVHFEQDQMTVRETLQAFHRALTTSHDTFTTGTIDDIHENLLENLAELQVNEDFFKHILILAQRLGIGEAFVEDEVTMDGYETDSEDEASLHERTRSYINEHRVVSAVDVTLDEESETTLECYGDDSSSFWKKPVGGAPGVRRLEAILPADTSMRFFSTLSKTHRCQISASGEFQIELALTKKKFSGE